MFQSDVSIVNADVWMLDDHAHAMQVKLCKANTDGVTTSVPGRRRKLAVGEVSPEDTIHRNYRIATRIESQITPKFVW